MKCTSRRPTAPLLLVLFSFLLNGCQHFQLSPPYLDNDSGGTLTDNQAAYDLTSAVLDLEIQPRKKRIQGHAVLTVAIQESLPSLTFDLDQRLKVSRVELIQSPQSDALLAFVHKENQLHIFPQASWSAGSFAQLRITYAGEPREAVNAPWDGGFTWAKTQSNQPWIATSVQGEGADLWWPCKDHPSDKPDSVTLFITVPQGLEVAANGLLVSKESRDDGKTTFQWHTNQPISSYNIALNIGPYVCLTDSFQSQAGDIMPVYYWVLPENEKKGQILLPEIKQHLAFYERWLGPYPFRTEKYGVAETPHLGMEHQTIIAYGNQYRGGPHGFDWLHHHELGHEWWGNLVTVKDWSDFWIHEGFCTYMQALYAEEREGPMAYHHKMYSDRRLLKLQHPLVSDEYQSMGEVSERLGNDPYYRGAWTLHTLRYLIGDEDFKHCLRRMAYPNKDWEERTDGSQCRHADSEDFIQLVNEVTGQDLQWFFDTYLYQTQLPSLQVVKQAAGWKLSWQTESGTHFPMPVEIKTLDGRIARYEVPNGELQVQGPEFEGALIDPSMWILKARTYNTTSEPATRLE